jgi:hypothetical protein
LAMMSLQNFKETSVKEKNSKLHSLFGWITPSWQKKLQAFSLSSWLHHQSIWTQTWFLCSALEMLSDCERPDSPQLKFPVFSGERNTKSRDYCTA